MILMPGEEAQLTLESAARAASAIPGDQLVGATPYRYVRLDMVKRQQSFTAAGTDFTQVQKTSPYFNVEGRYPENARELLVGKEIATRALAAGITEVVFDRNGYLYHGRVKSLADAAREGGLKF